jgi:hypothetical protein
MTCIIAQLINNGISGFQCNVVIDNKIKFVMMNARGEVISVAKHGGYFISTVYNRSVLIESNGSSSFHITDKFNNVAVIDMPLSLSVYDNITITERIKFDFKFNKETIVKTPKNATVMFEAMNKKKRTLMLQSFSHIKNGLNCVCDLMPLIFAPFMEAIRTDQSWYTIIDTFNV